MSLARTVTAIALAAGLLIGPTLVLDRTVAAQEGRESGGQGGAQRPTMEDVFIRFRNRPGPPEEALVRSVGGTVRHRYTIVNAIAARVPSQAIQGLRNNPNVEVVEPDIEAQAIHRDAPPGEVRNAWGVDRLDAEVLHDGGILGTGVRLAIVDSGSGPHPDLDGAIVERVNCIGVSPCQKGDRSSSVGADDNGHGTHVAGTAAAVRQNGFGGVVGMAPGAQLISCKALGSSGGGAYSDVVKCLEHVAMTGEVTATGRKLQVANFSLGSSQDPGTVVRDAFENAYTNFNVLIIAAAGNSGNQAGRGDNVIYPAKYASVVAVAATDSNDRRASFSSTGPDVEVSAPGVQVWSTHLNNGYGFLSGTSMASPHAAGAAALRASQSGALANASTLRSELRHASNVKDLGAGGKDNHFGWGLIDPLELTNRTSAPTDIDGSH